MRTLFVLASLALAAAACAAGAHDPAGASDSADTAAADAGSDAGDAGTPDAATVPTYAEVAPIIARSCTRCHEHEDDFTTLEDVKASKDFMEAMIEQEAMPFGSTGWENTPDGKKLLDFLENSSELE